MKFVNCPIHGLLQCEAIKMLCPEVRDNVEKSEYEDMFCDNLDKVQNVIKLCDISF